MPLQCCWMLLGVALKAIARTRENFKFRAAPGVMMLDHDGLPNGELPVPGVEV